MIRKYINEFKITDSHYLGEELCYKGERPEDVHQAFWMSIAKWYVLWMETKKGNVPCNGAGETCGLCLFFEDCRNNCPVMKDTGEEDCWRTPYKKYVEAQVYDNEGSHASVARKAAREELKYLIDLYTDFVFQEFAGWITRHHAFIIRKKGDKIITIGEIR